MQYTSKSIAIEYLELMIEKAELVIQRNVILKYIGAVYLDVETLFIRKTQTNFAETYQTNHYA